MSPTAKVLPTLVTAVCGWVLGAAGADSPGPAHYKLIPAETEVRLHLGTAGLLSFMGDEHLIDAPLERGTFHYDPQNLSQSSLELVFNAAQIRVLDPHLPGDDRREIQATMESDRVLDVAAHPEITFRSTSFEREAGGGLEIQGELTLRGQTEPITLQAEVKQLDGQQVQAAGSSRFNQTTFGIEPVSAGLGTVKVADEVTVRFQTEARRVSPD